MPSSTEENKQNSDRLPINWKRMRARYSVASAANYDRVLKKLVALGCMSADESERAAFVIIEKDEFRKLGIAFDDED